MSLLATETKENNKFGIFFLQHYLVVYTVCKGLSVPIHKDIIVHQTTLLKGVVGRGKGVVYLTSLVHPTDIGLQLGMACFLVAGKDRWSVSSPIFNFLFLPCHSLSSLLLSLLSLLPFSGRQHKMTHKGWRVIKPQHKQTTLWSIYLFSFQRKGGFTFHVKCLPNRRFM